MKVLFARVGYMNYYMGPQKGDEYPVGGGKYNENNIGHEAYNFSKNGRYCYGFVQPTYRKKQKTPVTINLEKIDPTCGDDSLDGVLVVFFAKKPDGDGQVIVGWYKNGTVYRYVNDNPNHDEFYYYFRAKKQNAVLLPSNQRNYLIFDNKSTKEGKPGQSNVTYMYKNKYEKKDLNDEKYSWIRSAIDYVTNYSGINISENPILEMEDAIKNVAERGVAASEGQGIKISKEVRKEIENYSMRKAKEYFLYKLKFEKIDDVSSTHSYDLHCYKNNRELMVEIKGTQTSGKKLLFTKNEIENAKGNKGKIALYILHSIKLTGKGKKVKATGGQERVINPWDISKGILKPITYLYEDIEK